jgi:cysteine desulfurase
MQEDRMTERDRVKGIYFDCNATTPLLAGAAEAAIATLQDRFANPSSTHWEGCRAQQIRESARECAAQVLDVQPSTITFTSGATESIHTAVFSALSFFMRSIRLGQAPAKRVVLFGATEHKVVPEALIHWITHLNVPFEVKPIPVDSEGQYEKAFLERELPGCAILCTMAVNNETGVIQDLDAVATLLGTMDPRPLWLVDAVQALGKIPLKLSERKIDFAAFSGHKIYAPKGVGLLYVRKSAPFFPLLVGGGQESGRRSGTEALPAVAGLGAVLREMLHPNEALAARAFRPFAELARNRNAIRAALCHAFPRVEFNTPVGSSVPTTVNFSVPGFDSSDLLLLFEACGIYLSAGSACQASKSRLSHVLVAMQIAPECLRSAARLSFGAATPQADIDEGCRRIMALREVLRSSVSAAAGVVSVSDGMQTCFVFLSSSHKQKDVLTIGLSPSLSWRVSQIATARDAPARIDLAFGEEASVAGRVICGDWEAVWLAAGAIKVTHCSHLGVSLVLCRRPDDLKYASSLPSVQPGSVVIALVAYWAGLDRRWSLPFACDRLPPVSDRIGEETQAAVAPDSFTLTFDQITQRLPTAWIVDVRERYECSELSPYRFAGVHFGQTAGHQPLSEFTCFLMRQLHEDPNRERVFVFVCRTGGRSCLAAGVMRDFGWQNAWSLKGGFSCLNLAQEKADQL